MEERGEGGREGNGEKLKAEARRREGEIKQRLYGGEGLEEEGGIDK